MPIFCHMSYSSGNDWLALVPFVGTVSILVYVTTKAFLPQRKPEDIAINMKIQKESPKVVNVVDIEDLGEKISYCRCWRSKKVFQIRAWHHAKWFSHFWRIVYIIYSSYFLDTEVLLPIVLQLSFFFFQFPLCDGAHGKHNEETGDNVGPLVLRRKVDATAK